MESETFGEWRWRRDEGERAVARGVTSAGGGEGTLEWLKWSSVAAALVVLLIATTMHGHGRCTRARGVQRRTQETIGGS